ncbi:MAG: dehydrogenase, partial [Pirellulaceae bacterium]|nr:dehydrogenase [Pirellulaceae bacterium]
AIRRSRSHNEVDYAAMSTMTAILGRMASYSGQMINWDDAVQSPIRLAPGEYAFDAAPPVVAGADGRYPVAVPGVTKVL